jgi:S1-C subfamily serine protease
MARIFYSFIGAWAAVFIAAGALVVSNVPAGEIESPAVKVFIGDRGHGSGIHIGNGHILTAGHVADGATHAQLDGQAKQPVEVLWHNQEYDVGLLQAPWLVGHNTASVSCRVPHINEEVRATGNPGPLEHMTFSGRVAKGEGAVAMWKSVFIADITGMGGMSGSGVLDKNGEVVGVLVGGPQLPLPVRSIFLIVPGSTVCKLLGRA